MSARTTWSGKDSEGREVVRIQPSQVEMYRAAPAMLKALAEWAKTCGNCGLERRPDPECLICGDTVALVRRARRKKP